MFQRSIFIASAHESKEVAMAIAQNLAINGYKPLRWWEEFPPGSITIKRLLEIAGDVDGAVFVCAATDKEWYRSDNVCMPRDNVILEYGMFIKGIGLERCLLLKDERTKLPSDLLSVAYEPLVEDIVTVSEKVVKYFHKIFAQPTKPPRIETLNIRDRDVVSKMRHPPPEWSMRFNYIGPEGANAWLKVRSDPAYQSEEVKADLRRDILSIIRTLEVGTFVSLGPGDGLLDRHIAISLRNHEPCLQYIPVDISDGLLDKACELLEQEVPVPICILGDFEDRLNFISDHIRRYAKSPILYGLIGNTLGNLDRSENSFLHNLKRHLSKSDFLLIELAAIKEGSATQTPPPSVASLSKGFRYFLSCGLARRFGLEAHTVFKDLETLLRVSFSSDASDIPGTQVLEFCAIANNQRVAYVRRYDWESFQAWLKNEIGFKAIDSRRIESPTVADRGLLLLKK